jgi:hypothetical protein
MTWIPERKVKQSQAIKEWKPWEKSTGPKTPAGKAISSQNSLKHGAFSAENLKQLGEIRRLLKP